MDDEGTIPMVCATSVMKPSRARIGQIGGRIALPRTVPIVNLVAAGIGGFLGLVIGLAIGGSQAIWVAVGLGAGAGWLSVTYSPLKNESLLKWIELKVKSQTRERFVNGRRVTVAVGTAVVKAPSSGSVLLLRSGIRVPAGQYDERGAVRSARNRNLDGASGVLAARSAPPVGALSLPTDAEPDTRRSRRERPPSTGQTRAVSPPRAATPRRVQPAPVQQTAASTDPMTGPTRRLKD